MKLFTEEFKLSEHMGAVLVRHRLRHTESSQSEDTNRTVVLCINESIQDWKERPHNGDLVFVYSREGYWRDCLYVGSSNQIRMANSSKQISVETPDGSDLPVNECCLFVACVFESVEGSSTRVETECNSLFLVTLSKSLSKFPDVLCCTWDNLYQALSSPEIEYAITERILAGNG